VSKGKLAMKKLYLISSLSVLSLSAISAANVNNKGTKKIRPSASQACQTTKVGTANVSVCVNGPVASSSLSREQLSTIQQVTNNLFKRHARMNSKAWVTPGYASSDPFTSGDDINTGGTIATSGPSINTYPQQTVVSTESNYTYAYYQTYYEQFDPENYGSGE
jgi:hypothetical protein